MVKPILETTNVYMYVCFTLSIINYLFGASKSVTFDFQLFPINKTTSRWSWNLIIMTLGDTFTNVTHITNTTLNHLYLNTLLSFQLYQLIKGFNVCARVYGLRLISSMSLDSTKDIQPVKSVKSICIHSLKPATYPLLRGTIRGV